jgi:hypothetical protein
MVTPNNGPSAHIFEEHISCQSIRVAVHGRFQFENDAHDLLTEPIDLFKKKRGMISCCRDARVSYAGGLFL